MKPFFHSQERRDSLWAEALKWLDTPFFPHAHARGDGVDCVNLIHEMNVAVGVCEQMTLPDYPMDRSLHRLDSLLLKFLLEVPELKGRLMMMPLSGGFRVGDILGIKLGLTDHHLAQVMPFETAIHCMERLGTQMIDLDDPRLTKRLLYAFRIMGEPS